MSIVGFLRKSQTSEAILIFEDPSRSLTFNIEPFVISQIEAEIETPAGSQSGVLLGTVAQLQGRATVAIDAWAPLQNGATDLRNYPPASLRAPGCVGYFRAVATQQQHPSDADIELFLSRFSKPFQCLLLVRKPGKAHAAIGLFGADDGAIVPIPRSPIPLKQEPARFRSGIAWSLILACIVFSSVWAYRSATRRELPQTSQQRAIIEAKILELSVKRDAGALVLQWDPTHPDVAAARMGVLYVEDGDRLSQQTFDPPELRSGKLIYLASNSNVRFRLDVLAPDGRTESASIRVLGPSPAPYVAPNVEPAEQAQTAKREQTSLPDAVVVRSRAEPPAPSPLSTPVVSEPAARVEDPLPPAATRAVEPSPGLAPASANTDTQEAASGGESVPETRQPILAQRVAAPAVTNTSPTLPHAVPEARAAVMSQPTVKRQTAPLIPLALQSTLRNRSRSPIIVSVKIVIDANGSVASSQVVNPRNGMLERQLEQVASSTAKFWSFYPARIAGKPVPSEMVINFKF